MREEGENGLEWKLVRNNQGQGGATVVTSSGVFCNAK